MDELTPSSQSVGLGGFPLSRSNLSDFREHGPRMRTDDLDAPYGEFVSRAPTYVFSRGLSRTLTSSMQAASNLAAFVFVVPDTPPLPPAGADQKNISPAPAQPLARPASAGIGQKNTFPEPAQPQAPNLSAAALEITPSAPAAQRGSIGVGTDNVSPTPTNPKVFFSQRSRGRRFSGVPCSASGSLA